MDFTPLQNYLDRLDKNAIPFCEIAVQQNHKLLFRHRTGLPGFEEQEAGRDLYYMYSATKPLTCTAAMRLVEEGKMSLEDPVKKYLPEFAHMEIEKNGKRYEAFNTITLEHLFTMTSGIGYDIGHPLIQKIREDTNNRASTREMMAGIAGQPLQFEPGSGFRYGLNHDVLGAVIEVVSGMSFGEYMKKYIFDPLGMNDTTFRLTPEKSARMHRMYVMDQPTMISYEQTPSCAFILSDCYESGGAGLISSLDDYMKFVDCVASGISPDGYRILNRESIDMMRKAHVYGDARPGFDRRGFGYGLGVQTMVDPAACGSPAPIGSYGWDGAAGAFLCMDPDSGTSIMYCQFVHACGPAFAAHNVLRNLVFQIVKASAANCAVLP